MTAFSKAKFAMYWAASCGGCEISVLNIAEKILDVDAAFEVVFWPVAADFKYRDLEAYPDGTIDLCLFNGAIRSSENEAIARLLRKKSKLLVAFGSCAMQGGIPALANLSSREAIFQAAYLNNATTPNSEGTVPTSLSHVPEGELHLPEFYESVKSLGQVVDVDYSIPGCPPEAAQIGAVMEAVISALQQGSSLPPRGSILGASDLALCSECPLEKHDKLIHRFYRPYELIPEAGQCLLEQGLVCAGPATRGGCGALCPQVGMGCRGCYGALDQIEDQGARILGAVASVIDAGKPGENEQEIVDQINATFNTLADPAGTFFRFSLGQSMLKRARQSEKNGQKGENR